MNEEQQYLDILREVYEKGTESTNRTNVGSTKLFGRMMRFDLSNKTIPVFTTKKVYFKGVVHELLWFLNGDTNIDYLQKNGVHIWDLDADKFAKKMVKIEADRRIRGGKMFKGQKDREKWEETVYAQYYGNLGPVYGKQWRNFGGIDQIKYVIEQLIENPNNRRILVNSWNPFDLDHMALPPCHVMFQFGVEDEKYLTCAMYQRSCDLFLGVPFNVASYGLLTHIMAEATGLEAKEFIWFGFDCHIYDNHRKQVLEQINRNPMTFPKINLDNKIKGCGTKLLDKDFLKYEDIQLVDYQSYGKIKAEMADYDIS